MNLLKDLWIEEDAVGVVEIILILVVLIGLVIIYSLPVWWKISYQRSPVRATASNFSAH